MSGILARLPADPPARIPFRAPGPGEAEAALLDPFRCPPEPVRGILEDAGTVKILHDAHQDLQHLARWTGARPAAVFDTRLAAGFCGLPSTLSLAKLVESACGVVLPKTETLTDWTRRPLTPEQLEYAAQDVIFLPRASRWLADRAAALGTAAWLDEETAAQSGPDRLADPPPDEAWRRLKLPGFLRADARAMHRVRALAAWRERVARDRDLPRRWVADDEAIARDPTLHDRATALLKELARKAEAARVDPALLATRAEATAWLADPDDPAHPLNRGWRRAVAGLG